MDLTPFGQRFFNKLNLSINGHRVPQEDVLVGNAAGSWLAADFTQVYRASVADMGNLDSAYDRNFGLMGGSQNLHTFSQCPVFTYDLTKKEVADFVGSASEMTIDWGLHTAINAGTPYWIYAVITTEAQVNLNMTAHRAVAEVIIP